MERPSFGAGAGFRQMIRGDLYASLQCGFFFFSSPWKREGNKLCRFNRGIRFKERKNIYIFSKSGNFFLLPRIFILAVCLVTGCSPCTDLFFVFLLNFIYLFFPPCQPPHVSSRNLKELKKGDVLQRENMMQNTCSRVPEASCLLQRSRRSALPALSWFCRLSPLRTEVSAGRELRGEAAGEDVERSWDTSRARSPPRSPRGPALLRSPRPLPPALCSESDHFFSFLWRRVLCSCWGSLELSWGEAEEESWELRAYKLLEF